MTKIERMRYEAYKAKVQYILDVLIDANDGITDACKDLGQLDDEFVREASVQQYKLRDMIQFWGLELHELDIMIK